MVIAENVPLEPNINKLSAALESTRDQTLKMFYWLDRAALVFLLTDKAKDYKHLTGPKKIYLDNTNLIYALGHENADIGNVRETFFMNQTRVGHDVISSSVSDFQIVGLTFEVGGRNKKQKQLQGVENEYVVKDDIEKGHLNVIPLWMIGLLY